MRCPDCQNGSMVLVSGVWKCACGAAQFDIDTLRASAHVNAAAMLLPRRSASHAPRPAEAPRYRRLSSA